MAATTTPSTHSLLKHLSRDFSQFSFAPGDQCSWSPSEMTVYYTDTASAAQLFHELAHGVLGHTNYSKDIELVRMEREAWDEAVKIAQTYTTPIDEEEVESHMDTYREWMHARSLCPVCEASGIQSGPRLYRCVECEATWRVNDARTCGLKRKLE